jgi:hypothetical protein
MFSWTIKHAIFFIILRISNYYVGRAIAQAVSRWLPTVAARVVDKMALGQVFSEYLGFPCQSSFHQYLHNHHHLSSGG